MDSPCLYIGGRQSAALHKGKRRDSVAYYNGWNQERDWLLATGHGEMNSHRRKIRALQETVIERILPRQTLRIRAKQERCDIFDARSQLPSVCYALCFSDIQTVKFVEIVGRCRRQCLMGVLSNKRKNPRETIKVRRL
jgi:hypothetical protein